MDDDHFEKVLPAIGQNRRLTVREAAEEVGICKRLVPPNSDRETEDASCCPNICAASTDTSLLIHEFLTKHETTAVPQQPYFPDLSPAEFFLFPKWKSSLKGRRFQTIEEVEENSKGTFAPFQKWKKTAYQVWRGVR